MSSQAPASFLTIPCELRNSIYLYLFNSTLELPYKNDNPRDALAKALQPQYDQDVFAVDRGYANHLPFLQTCKQIHDEAYVLAQALTPFHVVGDAAHPHDFASQIACLRTTKVGAIRNLTLTARISKLRAMNEAWDGLPFGNPLLDLEALTIIPKRPDANYSAYADIAYHSQAHILAYTFSETFKGLRNVRVVHVRNEGCFNEFYWELMYKALLWRLWNWGGYSCGVRFEEFGIRSEPASEQWFKAWLTEEGRGKDVGQEMRRFLGDGIQLAEPTMGEE